MNRRAMWLLLVATAAILLGGGAALAKTVYCDGGTCRGTDKPDSMFGSLERDAITAGRGGDYIVGNGGDDKLYGGRGNDVINSTDSSTGSGAGPSGIDFVDCGPGDDVAYADAADTVVNCEG